MRRWSGLLAFSYLRRPAVDPARCSSCPRLQPKGCSPSIRASASWAGDLSLCERAVGESNISFATALVTTLDARDRYRAGHSAAVAIYARDIAEQLGLSEEQQQLAHLCGLVHDIGKIGLPAGLLEKPGALTLEERRQMQEHSAIGERILGKVEDYAEIATIVRHHHERIDGMGYPDGDRGRCHSSDLGGSLPWPTLTTQ